MATHDYVIANASGAAVRSDLNNALAAIVSNNSNATEPATTYAYMWWADTGSTPPVLKIRNAANDAWITLFQLDGEFSTIALENGTAAAPSLYFKDSGTDTGLYSPGTDSVAITTGGTARATVDSSGRLLVGTSSTSVISTQILQGSSAGATTDAVLFLSRGTASPADGNTLGRISFSDNTYARAAEIYAQRDGGTWSASSTPARLVLSTTADGASSPTGRMTIYNDGQIDMPAVYGDTTASAANLVIQSSGVLRRSTSSIKYKTDVETLEDSYADLILNVRPVWYRSTCEGDNPEHGWWGFIAEEVAEIDPRLVHWKTTESVVQEDGSFESVPCEPEPEGVAYDRFVPHLLNLIKRQKEQIETQGAAIAALEARITVLEGAN